MFKKKYNISLLALSVLILCSQIYCFKPEYNKNILLDDYKL